MHRPSPDVLAHSWTPLLSRRRGDASGLDKVTRGQLQGGQRRGRREFREARRHRRRSPSFAEKN